MHKREKPFNLVIAFLLLGILFCNITSIYFQKKIMVLDIIICIFSTAGIIITALIRRGRKE